MTTSEAKVVQTEPPSNPHRSTTVLTHEESVLRNPFSLRPWLAYISFMTNKDAPQTLTSTFPIYERAVAALPGSYKLWYAYVNIFREYAAHQHPNHGARDAALSVSERAARALQFSPILWAHYIEHLLQEARLTVVRNAVNNALRALPITQHNHVWRVISDAFPSVAAPNVAAFFFARQAVVFPRDAVAPLCDALLAASRVDEAARALADRLKDPKWVPKDSARPDLALRIAHATSKRARAAGPDAVPALVKIAIAEAPLLAVELKACLAEFYTRRGDFQRAREVLEHTVSTATVVRDFSVAYDAYAELETALAQAAVSGGDSDASLHLARLENLVDRRPMLLSDVQLRQNPHNVHEWHRRARMFKQRGDAKNVVDTYAKAVRSVDAHRATNGRAFTLWLAFADYYTQAEELSSARRVLDTAVAQPSAFPTADDLAAVWAGYAETELRFGNLKAALLVLRRATTKTPADTKTVDIIDGVRRSRRLWMLMADIVHARDDVDAVEDVHTGMLDVRVASASSVLSGASYFENRRLFGRAFRLYDRGASALSWPDGLRVWVVYLERAVEQLGKRHPERVRDIFETALRAAPKLRRFGFEEPHPLTKHLYLMYADYELEQGGGTRQTLSILSRATQAARRDDCASLFRFRIVRTTTLCGATAARIVYEEALRALTDMEDVAEFASRYAALEMRLGEVDRARAIFQITCSAVDTTSGGACATFWNAWRDLEIQSGTDDSLRDMMRRRRWVELDQGRTSMHRVASGTQQISNMVRGGELDIERTQESIADHEQAAASDGVVRKNIEKPTEADDDAIDVVSSEPDKTSELTMPHHNVVNVDEVQGENPDYEADLDNHESDVNNTQKKLPTGLQRLMKAARDSAKQEA